MISYKDIKKAINSKLATFGVEVNSRDISEGFKRPSFFVQLEDSKRSGDVNQVHKSLTVQIYYYPTDRYDYSIEVLEVQEQLENLFELKLKVLDRFFNIDEVNSVLTDGVLSFSFDIAFYDGREIIYTVEGEELNSELMEELDIEKIEE
ncbi:phage tail terminator family protein [Heyndrickxia oleronia]|jgi:hypothetical protein|uniref:phage tail terminator family protein n=1 Tax=Heyndrickxia oleronia TaxID=38875 RepID=UPI002431B9CE|nr:hypothetical protein [Heyndrickxia oleronia]MCI1593217.1 hypothetical protein [Heyndrickxia oleronia]MCI1615458.1 hypothetical protein [Heyndrickxia oleronia]MCI1746192.1 hypothetical protein [Heyndrickxia oleronia]MCI1763575.1 hypothetical protein [Heyndrickxia oleronia]